MISACILCRDDASTLRACLESIRPHVDQLVIVDTGSIDESPRIAREFADIFSVYLQCNDPETEQIANFADARNHAMSLATGDVHFWADADDVVVGLENLRPLADSLGPEALVLVPYEYQHDAAGRPVCIHWRENIVKPRDKWRWSIPVHEVMIPQGISPMAQPVHNIRRIHRKQLSTRTPDPERNLRILKKYVAQVGEGDVRAWYYLGVEYSMRGDISNALRVLKRYVELAGWHDEKCLALLEIARIYQMAIRDYSTAIEWAMQAMLTKSWPEPYFVIAECFAALCDMGVDAQYNVKRAAHFAEIGIGMADSDTVLFTNPMKRFDALAILSKIYVHMGQIERALDTTKQYLATIPEDVEMRKLALQCQDILTKNTVVNEVTKLATINAELQTLGAFDAGQWETVQRLVGEKLGIARTAPPQLPAGLVTEQPRGDGCLDIVFLLGPQYEPWNPVTLEQNGMGGSETMAWNLAKRLRAIGHRVRLYAQALLEQEGVFDGVEYLDMARAVQAPGYAGIDCDVAIVSRNPQLLDLRIVARARLLWIHDVHAGDALTPARALRFDRILALSEWHKSYLLQCYAEGQPALIARLRPEDITVTRNGIDLARFAAPSERNPKRVIYSSSPDRGLQTLLEMWLAVLKEEPEAELHIFYGFENWEKSVAMGLRVEIPWLSPTALRQVKHMIRSLPRVHSHGRVGPAQLAGEMLVSGVWAYPTWFSETSCITAMEAQAAGCYTVATPVAALNETAGQGVLVDGAWAGEATDADRAQFVAAVVRALRGEAQPKTRDELQSEAARFSLDTLAADWDAMLRRVLAEVDERVVPEWRE